MKDPAAVALAIALLFVAALAAAWLVMGCAGEQRPTCTAADREALITMYKLAADRIIDSGACRDYDAIEECPPYRTLELHFVGVERGMCGG